ncbi:ABC transporter substrate-binding protein, partial [Escherichia coli]|nr:ABC transporter substrate-binding protein [Escherichia coli]
GNITAVNVSVKEAGKPDIFLEFKLRKNNKTGEWKAFDMVAEGISLLSAKQSELGGLIRQNGIDAVIAQLREHNAKPLVLKP